MKRFVCLTLIIQLSALLVSCKNQEENATKINDLKENKIEQENIKENQKNLDKETIEEEKKELENNSLTLLRENLNNKTKKFAVAYLGITENPLDKNFQTWIEDNNPKLVRDYPFIKEIPFENIISMDKSSGQVYLIVSADKDASLAVNSLKLSEDFNLITDEVLYRSDSAEPILIVSDSLEFPDIEINIVPEHQEPTNWNPGMIWNLDNNELKNAQDFLDFTQYGENGVDAIRAFLIDSGWRNLSDKELDDTTWIYNDWYFDFNKDNSNKDYDGKMEFYQIDDKSLEHVNKYFGFYKVYGDKIKVDVSNKKGNEIKSEYTILIFVNDEILRIEKNSDSKNNLPFFSPDSNFVELFKSFG